MTHLVLFKNIRGFGCEHRKDGARVIQEGDWLIAGPPWEIREGTARRALWDLLVKCRTEEEFLRKSENLRIQGQPLRPRHGSSFLRWLKRNWWMVRATRA